MPVLDIAKLIIEIEETVNPESEYYGKPVKWWEQQKNLYHYGIGLSNTHFFNLGTADIKNLQVLKRHDIIKQLNLDIRVISDIRSPFEEDEIIERLKYALRWLNDLPEDSSNLSISGKALTGLIFKDNDKWRHQENEPIHNEIDYKNYLKLQSPSLTDSKFRFSKRAKNWAIYYFILLIILGVIIAILTDSIPNEFWKLVLVGILLLLIVAVVALTLNIVSNFKWSGFQKKSLWDWLQLLVVPLILAISAFYLNYASAAKDKYLAGVQQERDAELAIKQKQQDVFKTYLSQMQNLLLKDTDQVQRNLSPRYKALATALTLTALDELNGERKGKVIAYLAKSDLINKDNPDVDLLNANLKGIELENIILTNVNISKAHMQNAKLSKVQFTASDLRGANFSGATLDDVFFSESNLIGSNFYGVIFKNVRLANSPAKGVCLSEKPNIEVDASRGQSDPNFITEKSLQGKFASSTTIESGKDCKEPEDKPKGLGGAKM